jgi:hypothetical protein
VDKDIEIVSEFPLYSYRGFQIVEVLTESITLKETPIPSKVVRIILSISKFSYKVPLFSYAMFDIPISGMEQGRNRSAESLLFW